MNMYIIYKTINKIDYQYDLLTGIVYKKILGNHWVVDCNTKYFTIKFK